MSKYSHIKTAFIGNMPANPRHAQEIERRLVICGDCPNAKWQTVIPGTDGRLVHQYRCTKCSCTLFKRIMALSNSCPTGRWSNGDNDTEDEEDNKWADLENSGLDKPFTGFTDK